MLQSIQVQGAKVNIGGADIERGCADAEVERRGRIADVRAPVPVTL